MVDTQADIALYQEAAQLNLDDPLRRGSTLVFPNYGQLVVTGDMHGHRRNFERTVKFCDLEHAAARHLLLQEIIHEEPAGMNGQDMSHLLLRDAAQLKVDYPEQVHFLQSNHELAQLIEQDISKAGRVVTYTYLEGMRSTYGKDYMRVADAMMQFIKSYPLAARTANRVLLTHSLPGPREMPEFDSSVLDRLPTEADLHDGGSAYLLVWGRHQTADQLVQLAEHLDVSFFVCGHQPQETGYDIRHDQMVILASDHNHGVLLAFDLKRDLDIAGLEQAIRPLASIA